MRLSDLNSTLNFPTVDVRRLLTPWEKCTSVTTGPVDETVLKTMNDRDYDYAPVFLGEPSPKNLLGLVSRTRLKELAEQGRPLAPEDPAIQKHEVNLYPRLDVLLDAMAEFPARIVTKDPGAIHDSYGILTLSDLNKHPLRVVIYEILAELEMVLADLVRATWGDAIDWVRKLQEDAQARILGYWCISKLDGVDTGPVTGATLSELLRAVGSHEEALQMLGFKSENSWKGATGRLPQLRNRVMHPVRPLLFNSNECRRLKDELRLTIELTQRIRSTLSS